MARDWTETETIAMLKARLDHVAPNNIAPNPIAVTHSREPDGSYLWWVDIHVRIPRVTEYDVTSCDETLVGALRRAYLGLNNEANVRRHADAANAQFRIAV